MINYLTKERYNEVVSELKELKTIGRKKVADQLKSSKELGDLSENSDYQEARAAKDRLEMKILELEALIKTSSIIKKSEIKSVVHIGSKVKVKKNKKETLEYIIVGSSEVDPLKGFISNESPVGKELLGKRVGEEFSVKVPRGSIVYKILSIS